MNLFGYANSSENFFEKGLELYKNKKFNDAKFMFERSIVFNPKDSNSYLYLAKIYNHQEDQILKRDNSKSNFELLSKMRLRIKEKNRLGETEANNNDQLEFNKAINFLEEIEEESKFARKRSLQKSVSRGLNRLLLERNLGKLKIDLGEKWTLESNNESLRIDPSGTLDPKAEADEKRKLKKAEEAMHRLLALNEC